MLSRSSGLITARTVRVATLAQLGQWKPALKLARADFVEVFALGSGAGLKM
jgi:hypothetical protein